MLLSSLIAKLQSIASTHDAADIHVTICDYADDSDESFNFKIVHGAEIIESQSKEWVSIFTNTDKKH